MHNHTETPIVCLSKGRASAKLAKTLVVFSEAPIDLRARFLCVVEPQDYEAYKAEFPKIDFWVLPQNDPGLPFVRQWVLANAQRASLPFWMIDDDISRFGFSNGKKVLPCSAAEAFTQADREIAEAQQALGNTRVLGQAAMEYQQFSWSATKSLAWRSYCDVCVWINAPKLDPRTAYRAHMAKEDRDFTIQVLASGQEVARLRKIAFTCPKNGSNEGGLKPLYDSKVWESGGVDIMQKAWPGVVSRQVKPDGRVDAKIDWKRAFNYYAHTPQ